MQALKDYDHFKRLRESKDIKKKDSPKAILKRYRLNSNFGELQLLAWMARYKAEKRMAKLAKK